jgi:hypothetical protein
VAAPFLTHGHRGARMKSSLTRWLVVTAVALFAFIILIERRGSDTAQTVANGSLLLPELDPRGVSGLDIQSGTNQLLSLERGTNRWFFRSPIYYPAQAGSVGRFLKQLAELRQRGQISAAEVLTQTNGIAAFGLSPPQVSITCRLADRRATLNLGHRTAIGGLAYAQLVGRDGLFLVQADFLKALPPSFDAWRDPGLANLAELKFDRILALPLTNGFELAREATNRQWRMVKPLNTLANSALIEHLLRELELAQAARFVSDRPRLELESFGLQPPQRELLFTQGTNDVFGLQIGVSPTNDAAQVYVRLNNYSNVVLASRATLAPWLSGFAEFSDRRLMIFKADAVDQIEIKAEESFALAKGTNDSWRIVAPYAAPADAALVVEALGEMTELEFLKYERDFATDFATYGLEPPRREYTLRAAVTNAPATNLVLARAEFGYATNHLFYARRGSEGSVVLALDPARLPRAAFQLRDRRIWDVSTNDIAAITVQVNGQTRRLLRNGPATWSVAEGAPEPLNLITLDETAFRLGTLTAERWVARGKASLARFGFFDNGLRVTLEVKSAQGQSQRTVRFGGRSPAGRPYAAVELDGQETPLIFECPVSVLEYVQADLVPAAAR